MNNPYLYRLHIGGIGAAYQVRDIRHLVGQRFDGFTSWFATGAYRGKQESTLVIEIVCSEVSRDLVEAVANMIREYLKQDSILVFSLPMAHRSLVQA